MDFKWKPIIFPKGLYPWLSHTFYLRVLSQDRQFSPQVVHSPRYWNRPRARRHVTSTDSPLVLVAGVLVESSDVNQPARAWDNRCLPRTHRRSLRCSTARTTYVHCFAVGVVRFCAARQVTQRPGGRTCCVTAVPSWLWDVCLDKSFASSVMDVVARESPRCCPDDFQNSPNLWRS